MPYFHVRICGKNIDSMADIVTKYKVTVARHTAEQTDSGFCIFAHANGNQIRRLEAAGYTVERLEDAEKAGKSRQKEVRKITVKAALTDELLLVKGISSYLNIADVETALTTLASPPNNTFVKLTKLPNKTWENRVCNAVKIGKAGATKRTGIYLLGGVHAREWGSSDILIHFVQQLTEAYRNRTGISIGKNTFTAEQMQALVNNKVLYVFPQANPDGRNFSMTQDTMWRKNRRPPADTPRPRLFGVDINRNYDFLWDYPLYFAANAPVANSKDPSSEIYIGPGVESEPETRNAASIFEKYQNIRYFIDIHSYSEAILYNWGDDDNQSDDPKMNFQNSTYNGKRGIANDHTYREYLAPEDRTQSLTLANTMRDAIMKVRGRTYSVKQSAGLYPTAGVSTDYAFARHLINPNKSKVQSFTIEWGSPNNSTPFHPPYAEMQKIIQEITSALLAFCIAVT